MCSPGRVAGAVAAVHDGREAIVDSAWRAAEHGIRYLPRERRAEALFAGLSVRENFALPTLAPRHDVGTASPGEVDESAAGLRSPPGHRLR